MLDQNTQKRFLRGFATDSWGIFKNFAEHGFEGETNASRRNVMEKVEEGDMIREKDERDLHVDKTMKSLRRWSN